MSPFKEPQPRKNQPPMPPPVPAPAFPPYARLGNEARWEEPKVSAKTAEELSNEWKPDLTPLTVLPDHSPFELRKAALEAACAIHQSAVKQSGEVFWENVGMLEKYLRDGTKPS